MTNTTVRGDSENSLGLENTAGTGLLLGDANRDYVVNSSDLALLLLNFNSAAGTWNDGNFNNTAGAPNGDVNSADLALLLLNFNGTTTPPSLAAGVVPEPSSIFLMLVAGAGLACSARRRR